MIIAGAGGFAKEIIEVAEISFPDETIYLFDDTPNAPPRFPADFQIIRSLNELKQQLKINGKFILGTGSPSSRRLLFEIMTESGGEAATLISKYAIVGKYENSIGIGVIILPGAIIETSNKIGTGCLIHVQTLISHDCSIGEFCEISPGAKILGKVTVGNSVSIGTNAVILPGINIGNNAIVGAGAVVTKNVNHNEKVAGVPAHLI